MIKEYNKDHLDKDINTEEKCVEYTGLTYKDVEDLTGFPAIIDTIKYAEVKIGGSYPHIEVEIRSSTEKFYYFLTITVGLNQIYNREIRSDLYRGGLSGKLIIHQAKHGLYHGLDYIICQAYGDYDSRGEWPGYAIWGKLGFLPLGIKANNLISSVISEFNAEREYDEKHPQYVTRIDQLQATQDGNNHWVRKGKTWLAKLTLKTNSLSLQILDQYQKSRGL
jgi:hypothetical protein